MSQACFSILLSLFYCLSASPVHVGDGVQNIVPLCAEILCPETNCDNPVQPQGDCCPTCEKPGNDQQCMYSGLLVEHGKTFHPSPSNSTSYSQCNECTCSDGNVTCKDLSRECPPVLCDRDVAVIPEEECCPVCPDPVANIEESPEGCTDIDGRKFTNGDSWHPAYPDGDIITCITCTCTDSQQRCVKLPCPEHPLPPCNPDEPVRQVTLCCPTCSKPTGPPPSTAVTTPTPITLLPAVVSPDIRPNTDPNATPPISTPCDPTYTVKVWRHRWEDAVAAEFTQERLVKTYRWTALPGGYTREQREIGAEGFSRGEYNLLGWTLVRRVNGLSSRANKRSRIESCTSDCANLVVRFLRPMDHTVGCDQDD